MPLDPSSRISTLVESIKAHRTAVEFEANRLRTPAIQDAFDKTSARSWCLSAMGDSLVRVRLFLEQNFNFIETMGVVAVSRYLFELSVWLHLFERDERYGLVYYGQLIETQQRYYSDYLGQLQREVELLLAFEKKEHEAQDVLLNDDASPEDIGSRYRATAQMIDAQAALKFSLYTDDAKVNGYGFQAHLVETQAISSVEAALETLQTEQAEFETHVLPLITDLVQTEKGKKKRWEWKEMAVSVGLLAEYDFLYAYASKLLHATPASITTDQKNLELSEFCVFLKYIDVKTIELIDLARRYPRNAL